MARKTDRLTVKGIGSLGAGLHADGKGLYLRVEATGARRWVFIFRHHGKRCEMGLGPFSETGLSEARETAASARRQVAAGLNPIIERRRQNAAVAAVMTFGELMDEVVAAKAPEWRNRLSLHQWTRSATVELATLRPHNPAEITTEDVLTVLKPVWIATPETGRRLRGRLEHFLDAAKARGLRRDGDNPARWRGHLSLLLGQRQKLTRGHHAAVPFDRAKDAMAAIRAADGLAARALELTILTAARSNEVIGAYGDEFDLAAGLWTVPAGRMKRARPHRVALSAAALVLLKARIEACGSGPLFPGQRRNTLSNMAMPKVMAAVGWGDFTVHGWRATFRTWAGERTNFPRELAELALSHRVGDDTELAYSRGDGLERRRQLMEAWAQHCQPVTGNVIRIA
ncbi:MAG: integrase arm-type DNA-binding domain-containing protein [Alphaproteobacteria bacterium]|nr:integrase arm-type DNA-binding domain-containing protein [Alphaproteobacteria bacterium]